MWLGDNAVALASRNSRIAAPSPATCTVVALH
jgi:hypothetical protein